MLSIMIIILPAILAIFIYYKFANKISVFSSKLFVYIFFNTLFTNFILFIGLKLIGMHKFNLFLMSSHFKIKWLIGEFILTLPATYVLRNILTLDKNYMKESIRRIFPASLFLITTYSIYTPSALFLSNIEEFLLHYTYIIPFILFLSFILMAAVYIASLCLSNANTISYYAGFIFSIALGTYVQSNFLNSNLPSLDGTEINWALYHTENLISICFWGLSTIIILLAIFLWQAKTDKILKYAAYLLSAIQLISLLFLLFTSRLDDSAHRACTKDGEFTIGQQNNIILFVVDTLQADVLNEYLLSDAYPEGRLNDFMFFNNTVSGGAPTGVALPLLLTGIEYDPAQPFNEYAAEIWEETPFYDDLLKNNYDIRFYTSGDSIPNMPDGIIQNYGYDVAVGISDYPMFCNELLKLVNFYIVPHFLKERFWLSTQDLINKISYADNNYRIYDPTFYRDFQAAGKLSTDYENAFRLYHLYGVHSPFFSVESGEELEKNSVSEQQVLISDMKIIYEYIEDMQEAGVYDASTIIITGDHGRHEQENIEANPAVLIKLPYESHELAQSSAPIHFRNLVATMAKSVVEDASVYGPCAYDITDHSDAERLHTIDYTVKYRVSLDEPSGDFMDYARLIISGTAHDGTYHVWNPYNINRINYPIGELIDFTTDNNYAKEINYRLYKENNTAIASNELSICFDLTNYKKKDTDLHFIYSDIYNSSQKIRIYVDGHKIQNIVCTQENVGKDNVISIPRKYVKDGILTLRMVFPNAVTPRQLDSSNSDTRILSVAFDSMWFEQ